MSTQKITLTTSDGVYIEVERQVAESSVLIKNILEDLAADSGEAIPILNVSEQVMRKVIAWCEQHKNSSLASTYNDSNSRNNSPDINEWDQKFLQVNQEMLFEIILAANYLDIEALLNAGCKTVASTIKACKSPYTICHPALPSPPQTVELGQFFDLPPEIREIIYEFILRDALASFCVRDERGTHIRVYYQDTGGDIREAKYDDDRHGWSGLSPSIVGKGRKNTSITAVYLEGANEIRVYFLSVDSRLVECIRQWSDDGGWQYGTLTNKDVKAAPYSNLASITLDSTFSSIILYYQTDSDNLGELCYKEVTNEWLQGTVPSSVAFPGTGIAAATSSPRNAPRICYRLRNGKLVECCRSLRSE